MDELLEKGRLVYVYEESGKYDLQEQKDEPLDGIWCSIYDMLQLAQGGIVEAFEEEDVAEAVAYLKESQPYTLHHKNDPINF